MPCRPVFARAARGVMGALLLLTTACSLLGLEEPAPAPPAPAPGAKLVLQPASFADLPGWQADKVTEALPALLRSCDKLLRQTTGVAGKPQDWNAPCSALKNLPPGNETMARAALERWFQPWRATDNGNADGLFTGYYEADLRGSRTRHGRYTVPLYRRPADLVMVDLGDFRDSLKGQRIAGRVTDGKLKPYEDRRRIDAGSLAGKGLELVWLDDAVDAFFLHIQGSGRVVLEEGGEMRVAYDGQNGWPYVAIGRQMAADGKLDRDGITMQSIRAWLVANPGQAQATMQGNPSYVFFKPLEGDGPLGAQGVALTPGRSLAVDHSHIPYGLPVWLDVTDPEDGDKRLSRLMVAQDTGGAIQGPVRGDVFWGHGPQAENRAGLMKSRGGYWLLLPRTVTPPGAAAGQTSAPGGPAS
ncbi:murein transglycosylase A [Nitrospirillum iridis]|uniref:peptidoglycan lytic exotransglycosylase n=1 Tax=Nitrospirillum iridis TaxID=765888 RepID=A0A7X0B159_9PROT|nr:MltA domain-containing protein [Nitrospirillum iridis]MBB6253472.1 membrane-bound lytic murein transglycosylase A [Nitrospirillum iridis]